jgi:hypothetical protein
MSERDFIYWLSGFLERNDVKTLSEEQVKTIIDHLRLVVDKITLGNYLITR